MNYQSFAVTDRMKNRLLEKLRGQTEFLSIRENPLLAGLIACLGIVQEVGTANDELHRHLLYREGGKAPSLASMRSEIITWRGEFGVRIWSTECDDLKLDHDYLAPLLHPRFTFQGSRMHQLVVFPTIVSEIAKLSDIEATIVKPWAINTIFGGPDKLYYVTNDWEVMQNDALRMARLLGEKRIPLMGTHDLCAHVAGVNREEGRSLAVLSRSLLTSLSSGDQSSFQHLLVPYLVGMVLDDLAQPRNYGCSIRRETIRRLVGLQEWVVSHVRTVQNVKVFPEAFREIIEASRNPYLDSSERELLTMKLASELDRLPA